MKKIGNKTKIYIILAILLVLITLLSINGATSGMTGSSNSSGIKNYKSIDDMLNNIGFEVSVPNIVYNYSGEYIKIASTMGQIIEISSNDFSFKASPLVSYNVDILGMYDDCEEDKKYTVSKKDSKIKFFRYRLGYKGYEHCTIIDWCSDTTTYGLLIGKILTRSEILELAELTEEDLTETNTEEILALESENKYNKKEELDTELEYKTYEIGNKFSIDLPVFTSDVNVIDEDGIAKFYIDKILAFVIIYNDYDIDSNTFSGQSETLLNDGIILKYRSDNPFDQSHIDYDNYNNFIKTIDSIKQTIVFK